MYVPSSNRRAQITEDQRAKILYSFAFVTVSLSSGLVYGWPALRRNLVSAGTPLSENQLGAIFTLSSWSTQGGRLFFGIARDRYLGTRITAATCLVATAGGCVGIAFASEDNFAGLAVSMFMVGLGSGGQLCLQPVASLFREKLQGSILASLSGAFQVSGLIFLFLTTISKKDRRISFGSFGLVIGLNAVFALIFLPKKQFIRAQIEDEKAEKNIENGDSEQLSPDNKTSEVNIKSEDGENSVKKSDRPIAVHANVESDEEKGVTELVFTWEYFLLVLWFSVEVMPLQYYVATIGFQMERKGDTGRNINLYAIIYAASAVFAPLLGKIADVAGLGVGQAIGTILTSASFFVLASDWSLDAHVSGIVFYGIGRMIVYGMFFTNVGKRFGYTHFGTLAGLGLFISAVVSLLQYPLITLAADGNEKIVNYASGSVIALLGLPYCFWLGRRERSLDGKPTG
mmetsp:Transcript_21856/g.43837  ORF Transcript_21856/g.43837 Transcript_21856/m.43837 type:complete len:457 (+) Transcript_21856:117-1487(+)|eukprot:CAMPEP_0194313354 /NCGR_PEP_ID=MMETSP0171-20130528/10236_1 /TAXON_ID=218684 /ORGANISM="Corethron pennatum, Strain L29A3" /LENGTH=456 /DNA_ID=CAMNT_0039068269 /DNA_START=40 /DNA_END=1410 /DNA_ORIENTATION=+